MGRGKFFDWVAGIGEQIVPAGSPIKVQGQVLDLTQTSPSAPQWGIKLDSPIELGGEHFDVCVVDPASINAVKPHDGERVQVEGRLVQSTREAHPILKVGSVKPSGGVSRRDPVKA